MAVLVFLRPKSRLIADKIKSPKKPETPINKLAITVCKTDIGVKNRRKYPIITVQINPPKKPSQVLFGLTLGVILCLPKSLPKIN